MAKEFRMLINGKWCRAASGKTFKSINPANEGIIGLFQEGNEADARKAVQAAKKAFPLWAGVPAPKRGEILFGIANELNERKDEFAELISLETGKPLTESKGEAQEAIDIAYYLAGEGKEAFRLYNKVRAERQGCFYCKAASRGLLIDYALEFSDKHSCNQNAYRIGLREFICIEAFKQYPFMRNKTG